MLDPASEQAMREILPIVQKNGRLLETGTGWGDSSKFFSDLLPDWVIYTIDAFGLYGDGRIYSEFKHDDIKEIIDSHPKNVIQILSDAGREIKWELPLDVLYIDDDHRYEGCKAAYLNYGSFLKKGGLIIFDDYIQENNPTNGVKKVVEELLNGSFGWSKFKILYSGVSIILQKI